MCFSALLSTTNVRASVSNIRGFSQEKVVRFQKYIKELMEPMAENQFPPLHMCNTEETGILALQEPEIFFWHRRVKTVGYIARCEREGCECLVCPSWQSHVCDVHLHSTQNGINSGKRRRSSCYLHLFEVWVDYWGTFHRLVAKHCESC